MDNIENFKKKLVNSKFLFDEVSLDLAINNFPIRDEDWKYTKLNNFLDFINKLDFEKRSNVTLDSFLNFEERVVLENGKVKSHSLATTKLEEKRILLDSNDFLSSLNASMIKQEIILSLTENSILNISLIANQAINCPRIKINCSSNSTVVINIKGLIPEYFNNYLLKIDLDKNSELKVIIIQEENQDSYSFANIMANIEEDAKMQIYSFNLGAKLNRNNIRATMLGENSNVQLFGLNILSNNQHIDNHTILDHAKPNCESTEIYKGVYSGKSKGIFDGTIIVRKDAQKTNAIQRNQSLILGNEAVSNAKPQLKIWADDVKCTHGATVGQIDENALFYLKSRGIPENIAKAMLIKAFCSEILSGIEINDLKLYLDNIVSEKLEKEVLCQQ